MENRNNIQYTTFSLIRYIKDFVFNAILIYILVELYFYLNTNPNLTVLILGLLIIAILLLNSSIEINVYNKILQVKRKYFFGVFSHKVKFQLSDINKVTFEGNFSKKSDFLEDILSFVSPIFDSKNTLKIHTKDEVIEYKVYIYKEKLEKVAEIINS